jgi:methionyl-tRNA formyltransferase
MRIVFMGTPDFAVPSLERLIECHQVVGVFTRVDKPKGRGQKLQYTPVKEKALENNISVFQPKTLRMNSEAVDTLKELKPEAIVVAAYGMILPKEILELPPLGCINVHASLLPQLRGAAPINWAIIRGHEKTGITTMLMGEGIDTGDMLLKEETLIGQDETAGELFDRLSILGGEILIRTLEKLEKGSITPLPQDDSKSSYAPMLSKELGHINWDMDSKQVHNLIRGVNPWPGAYCFYEGKMLKILDADFSEESKNGQPGKILKSQKGLLEIECRNGRILVKQIQELGGKRMDIVAYLNGHTICEGYYLK